MVYAPAITVQALVEQKQRLRTLQGGQTIMTRFKLTILTVLDPQGTSNRTEPIDTRDKFVLVDGSTGPIVDVEGLIDPATGSPYMYEVWLGVAAGGGQR
jgi:hypothetical protein